MSRVFRAIQKMTGADALPAWADFLIGVAEFATEMDGQGSANGPGGNEDAEIQVVE
jgi:hypothetical protein